MRWSAIHIKINVLCILTYLHSILIAKKSSQSQLVPRSHTPTDPSYVQLNSKPRLAVGWVGARAWAKANLRPLSKGSDVAYLIFFSVFYHFMLCHHHRQHQLQERAQAQSQSQSESRLLKREQKIQIHSAWSGQSCSLGFCAGIAETGTGMDGIQICTLNYKLKSLKSICRNEGKE